jgi:hypothetical protein
MRDMSDAETKKDERALEALLAAAFRLDCPEEVSADDAEAMFKKPVRLSKEDREAIESWGTGFVEGLIKGQKLVSEEQKGQIEISKELAQESYALNRDKEGTGLDEKTRRKIDEERKRTLEEEENEGKDAS